MAKKNKKTTEIFVLSKVKLVLGNITLKEGEKTKIDQETLNLIKGTHTFKKGNIEVCCN